MSKEKSAFPVTAIVSEDDDHGITYRQYLAARVYPEMLRQISSLEHWKTVFEEAAELTWQAVDALVKSEEVNNGEDNI